MKKCHQQKSATNDGSLTVVRLIKHHQLARICFTHFKSCDDTLGSFRIMPQFALMAKTFHATKYVKEITTCFIKGLITSLEMGLNKL